MTQQIDGWTQAQLEASFSKSYGVGADNELPDEMRFVRGVAELARLRHAQGERHPDQPTVFLLHPKTPEAPFSPRPLSDRVPMLDEGDHPISGRIWMVNQVANDGVYVGLEPAETAGEVFNLIAADPTFSQVPTMVLLMQDDKLKARFYPAGLSDTSHCYKHDFDGTELSCAEVLEVVDSIWLNELSTPEVQGAQATTWEDASKLLPIKETELLVQKVVKIGLTGRYAGAFKVHHELTTEAGRFDLLIEQMNPQDKSQVTRHVLLELKVLKDITSKGTPVQPSKNKDAIKKGIRQAVAYRRSWGVRASALCCFDMRADYLGHAAFAGFEEKALEKSVELWIRHVFNSSEKYRQYVDTLVDGA